VSPTGQSSREEDSVSEIYAYRANDELTKAWREYQAQRDEHIKAVVDPFVAKYPNHTPLVDNWQKIIGFSDGDPKNPPPAGLSRSQRRNYLMPARGKAGDEWREWMKKLAFPTRRSEVLREFGLGDRLYVGSDGRHFLGHPAAVDFGEDGVFVYMGCEIDPLPECVTAVKRSEFYAAQERAEARQKSGVSS
jgi:hypothetical protein